MSAGRYINQLRLNIGARLLRESLMPQKEIADHIGYSDLSHFHTAFRREFKVTPGQYRKQQRLDF